MHLPTPTHRRMLASAYIYTIMNIYKCIEHTHTTEIYYLISKSPNLLKLYKGKWDLFYFRQHTHM